jgi:hypothetical protein
MSKNFAQALTDKQLLVHKPFVYKLWKSPDYVQEVFPELAEALQGDGTALELYSGVSEEIVKRNLTELGTDAEFAQAWGSRTVVFDVYED